MKQTIKNRLNPEKYPMIKKENIIDIIRGKKEYFIWKEKILERDNWTCQNKSCVDCFVTSTYEQNYCEPHHIKSIKQIVEEKNIKTWEDAINCKELWDLNNGITLCKECHRIKHFKN